MCKILMLTEEKQIIFSLGKIFTLAEDIDCSFFDCPYSALKEMYDISFDIVVVDYHSAYMNGADFLLLATQIHSAISSILIIDQFTNRVSVCALHQIMDLEVIQKPYEITELLQAVHSATSFPNTITPGVIGGNRPEAVERRSSYSVHA